MLIFFVCMSYPLKWLWLRDRKKRWKHWRTCIWSWKILSKLYIMWCSYFLMQGEGTKRLWYIWNIEKVFKKLQYEFVFDLTLCSVLTKCADHKIGLLVQNYRNIKWNKISHTDNINYGACLSCLCLKYEQHLFLYFLLLENCNSTIGKPDLCICYTWI